MPNTTSFRFGDLTSILVLRRPVEHDRDRRGTALLDGLGEQETLAIGRDLVAVVLVLIEGFDAGHEQRLGPAGYEARSGRL